MSSPPYQGQGSPPAHSPPYPANAQLPSINTVANGSSSSNRKRTAGDGGPSPSLKRRKPSTMSIASTSSAHPLRQTSFPPEDAPLGARSPSVGFDNDNVSMVSGSAVSTTGGGGRVTKKRGRKSKAEKAREAAEKEGTPSVVGGRAMTVASGRSGAGGARSAVDGEGPDDEEEDDKDIKAKMGVAQFERSREEREEEKRLRFMLVQQMDADQAERYEMWHAAKLTEATVRRVSRRRSLSWETLHLRLCKANRHPDRQRNRVAISAGQCLQGYAVSSQSLRGRPDRRLAQGSVRMGRQDWRAPS